VVIMAIADSNHFWGKLDYNRTLRDRSLALCSDAAQALYLRVRCLAGVSKIRGLLLNEDGTVMTPDDLGFHCRRSPEWAADAMAELIRFRLVRMGTMGDGGHVWEVPIVLEDVANFEEIREERSKAGKAGAAKRWKSENSAAIATDGKSMANDGNAIFLNGSAIPLPLTNDGHATATHGSATGLPLANHGSAIGLDGSANGKIADRVEENRVDKSRVEESKANLLLPSTEGNPSKDNWDPMASVHPVSDPGFSAHWEKLVVHLGGTVEMARAELLKEVTMQHPWKFAHWDQMGGWVPYARQVIAKASRSGAVDSGQVAKPISQGQALFLLERELEEVREAKRANPAFVGCKEDMDSGAYQSRTPEDEAALRALRAREKEIEKKIAGLGPK